MASTETQICVCTCGEVAPHIIARRTTSDGSHVCLWDDGSLTWSRYNYIRGSARPRTTSGVAAALAAGWLLMGDVELYSDDEVPDLLAAAKWAVAHGRWRDGMISRFNREPALRPVWTVLETNRDGRPTVRCWVLPRLCWPGLAVWAECGRYAIMSEIGHGTGTYEPTGFEFRSLAELQSHLAGCRVAA